MRNYSVAVAVSVLCLGGEALRAQANPSALVKPTYALFVGAGKQDSLSTPAWTLGFLYTPAKSSWNVGFDLAGEGAARNNTTGHYDDVEQAFSLNLLAGANVRLGQDARIGVSALLGARSTNKECAESYLGYECYADAEPTISYTVNFGGLAHLSYKQLMVGARRTAQSAQVLLGYLF